MFYMLETLWIMAKCRMRALVTDEDGDVNVVSMVVLMGIAVLLAVVFKDQIKNLITHLVGTITRSADEALGQQ